MVFELATVLPWFYIFESSQPHTYTLTCLEHQFKISFLIWASITWIQIEALKALTSYWNVVQVLSNPVIATSPLSLCYDIDPRLITHSLSTALLYWQSQRNIPQVGSINVLMASLKSHNNSSFLIYIKLTIDLITLHDSGPLLDVRCQTPHFSARALIWMEISWKCWDINT